MKRTFSAALAVLCVAGAAAQRSVFSGGAQSYITGGSSSVSTALSTFNVKLYGAVGDGATNDTTAINSAVTAVIAAGGGVVYFPPGIYVLQGVNLDERVIYEGAGSATDALSGVTTLRTLVTGVANMTPMFRMPAGTRLTNANWYGGGFRNIYFDNNTASAAIPSAVTTPKQVALDYRTPQKQVCTFSASTDKVTLAGHAFVNGDIVQFDNIGGGLATVGGVALYDNFNYYVVSTDVPNGTFKISLTAGGAALDLDGAGTGTNYVGLGTLGLYIGFMENCYFTGFDVAWRGSCLGDDQGYLIHNCRFAYNWIGIHTEEGVNLSGNTFFKLCHGGLMGRVLDHPYDGLEFLNCDYGAGPLGVGGPWGTTFGFTDGNEATGRKQSFNNSKFIGCTFYDCVKVGLTVSNGCSVIGSLFEGTQTDTNSVGLSLHGGSNIAFGNQFGEGNAATSFGRAGILLDNSAVISGGGTNSPEDNTINSNLFNLVGCPDVSAGIRSSATYPPSASGANRNLTMVGNKSINQGYRFLDMRGGVADNSLIVGNSICNESTTVAGSLNITSGDGFIEGPFYGGNISSNTLRSIVVGLQLLKATSISDDPHIVVTGNANYYGNLATALISIADAHPLSIVHSNLSSALNSMTGTVVVTGTTTRTLTLPAYSPGDNLYAAWTAGEAETINISGTQHAGQVLIMAITCDGSARLMTFNTGLKPASAGTFLLTLSKQHTVAWVSDGTNFLELSRAGNE